MAICIKTLTTCGLVLAFGGCSPNSDASTGPSSAANVAGTGSTGTVGASTGGGSNSDGLGGAATGGATSTGGPAVTGGALAAGGARATGGVAATGGAFNTGGVNSAGGAVSTGGLVATGGTSSSGAAISTGGKSTTGGTSSTGGKLNATSTSSTGGKTSTGGTPSTGGKASTGGTPSTGGAAATGGSVSTCTPSSTYFSFFITSRTRLFALAQAFNGSTAGFGGDFRYGTGNGLTGADVICTAIAEASMPGNCKVWRAFLSTSTVSAISRVGAGPWYDRLGRIVTTNTAGLVGDRPTGANSTIINDLPDENGTPHELEETSTTATDNHDILTGSTTEGTLYGSTANCSDWTSSAASTSAKPRVGHSWSAQSGTNWISCLNESGCGPGYNLIQNGGPGNDGTVGSGGGYGAIYCLATTP